MSTGVIKFMSSKRKKKREYSKNGCRECKRRKIKCDEGKPECWQCKRLTKVCSYPETGERVLRVSKKRIDGSEERYSSAEFQGESMSPETSNVDIKSRSDLHARNQNRRNSCLSTVSHSPNSESRMSGVASSSSRGPILQLQGVDTQEKENINRNYVPSSKGIDYGMHPTSVNLSKDVLTSKDFSPIESTSTDTIGNDNMFPFDSSINDSDFNQNDLAILAMDLNHIVNDIMFEFNYDGKSDKEISRPHVFDETTNDMKTDNLNNKNIYDINEDEYLPKNIPYDFIKVKESHEKLYLEEFYNDLANVLLPFRPYDPNAGEYINPVRDILLYCASKESFLLAAILAQGARISFKKYRLQEDENAYCYYLSTCLKLLEPALKYNKEEKHKSVLTFNIEAVLLTVLLLTTENALNTKQDWRKHLRGAKDILLKYAAKNPRGYKSGNSKILIFCKYWYISFEILAGLSSRLGGTLRTDKELDLLITTGDDYEISVLRELQLISNNNFNLLCGFHNSCIFSIRDLIKVLNKFRQKEKFLPTNSFEYLRLLSEFYQQSQIEFVDKECIILASKLKHGVRLEENLLDPIDNNKQLISWMDSSHQAYVLASIITILTKCFKMTYDSLQIQIFIEKLISLISFLESIQKEQDIMKYCMMMIQWPILVAGMNCDEKYRLVIMKFFRLSAQIGSGSAGFSLRQINQIWKRRSNNEVEEETSDYEKDVDMITY
ncbi:Piso0_002225 [Millerozyma farinosa CBS 7064]|uniref:Piso0_002225 protein n=1 Tax=Pichia sorbitophila (strain ATCC MYA-4447 / BCRC 22081 / CBS 7064 / NBRC 10061 / NRRL Y-12695) TaxID=559304 RepID=G8YC17_PICSO|nr:Piso0_002225 [Millerozyma farinosa CBS 7064]